MYVLASHSTNECEPIALEYCDSESGALGVMIGAILTQTNVRRTDTAQRIHIEYEVTNAADVHAMMKDKTSDEDALKQLITPKPKGE